MKIVINKKTYQCLKNIKSLKKEYLHFSNLLHHYQNQTKPLTNEEVSKSYQIQLLMNIKLQLINEEMKILNKCI